MSKEWESMSILIMQSLGILLSFACKVLMVTQTNLKTCMGDNFIDHGGIVKIFVDKKQNDLSQVFNIQRINYTCIFSVHER